LALVTSQALETNNNRVADDPLSISTGSEQRLQAPLNQLRNLILRQRSEIETSEARGCCAPD
jgi:ABC-type phosphonate transport system ATPase subunit